MISFLILPISAIHLSDEEIEKNPVQRENFFLRKRKNEIRSSSYSDLSNLNTTEKEISNKSQSLESINLKNSDLYETSDDSQSSAYSDFSKLNTTEERLFNESSSLESINLKSSDSYETISEEEASNEFYFSGYRKSYFNNSDRKILARLFRKFKKPNVSEFCNDEYTTQSEEEIVNGTVYKTKSSVYKKKEKEIQKIVREPELQFLIDLCKVALKVFICLYIVFIFMNYCFLIQ